MKEISYSLTIFLVLCALFYCANVIEASAVIGIDFGSEFIKVGIRKPGSPIDVVLNEQTKRKTPNIVGFRGKDRFFGESAKTLSTRFPGHMFKFVNLFLARQYDKNSELFKKLQYDFYLPFKLLRNRERNATIDIASIDETNRFIPEELMAMILEYIQKLSSETAGIQVKDCVFSIPPHFTIEQRNALLNSASLAGLNVLGLQHSHTSLSIQYAVTKFKEIKEMDASKQMNILFLDLGSTGLTVSVAEYKSPKVGSDYLGHITTKGVAWDDNIGGIDFDAKLVKFFIEKFKEKYGIDVSGNSRATTRLFAEAKKHKEILSANEKTLVYIDSLADDKDLKLQVTRDDFIQMTTDLTERIITTVDRAIMKSKLSKKEISAFELFGGGSRVPSIQQQLKDYYGDFLSHSLNSDEAIATGATFHAASLSKFFQARKFEVIDIFPHQIEFSLSNSGNQNKAKSFVLFKEFEQIEAKKSANIPRKEDFTLFLKYGEPQYTNVENIFQYDVSGMESVMAKLNKVVEESEDKNAKPKVKMTFTLDSNGIKLESANAQVETTILVPVPVQKKQNNTDSSKKEEQKSEEKPKEDKQDKKDEKDEVEMKAQKKLFTYPLKTSEKYVSIGEIPEDYRLQARKRMDDLNEHDRMKKLISKTRNDLEGYIYTCKYQLIETEDYHPYRTDAENEKLTQLVDDTDNWMYNEATEIEENSTLEESLEIYRKKLDALKEIGDAIFARKVSRENREKALKHCESSFNATLKVIETLQKNAPHITEEERNEVLKDVEEAKNWIHDMVEKQKNIPLYEPAVVNADEIEKKCFLPSFKAIRLSKKPKPEPPKEEKSQNTTTEGKPEGDEHKNTDNQQKTTNKQEKTKSEDADPKANEQNAESSGKAQDGDDDLENKGQSEKNKPPKDEL